MDETQEPVKTPEQLAVEKAAREKAESDAILAPWRAMTVKELKAAKRQFNAAMDAIMDQVRLLDHALGEKAEDE